MSKIKNLIIASGTFKPEVSGQSTFVGLLRNYLKSRPAVFPDVQIVAYGNSGLNDSEITYIERNIFRYFSYVRRLRQLLNQTAIIFAQDLVSSGFPAALVKRSEDKLIIRIGGDFLWEKAVNNGREITLADFYKSPKKFKEKLYLLVYKYVLAKADFLIFNSNWQRQLYQDYFKLNPLKTAVIENAVSNAPMSMPDRITDQKIFIFAGRLVPLKNIGRLIEAAGQIKDPNFILDIYGQGPARQKLQDLAAGKDFIRINEPLDRQELMRKLAGARAAIIPSLTEINPNFILEALSLGRPCIVTKETGLGGNYLELMETVDPLSVESIRQGIEKMLDDKFYQKQLAKISQGDFSYTNDQAFKKYLNIFEQL